MSIDVILEELEKIHEKLDRLLAKGTTKGFKMVEHEKEDPPERTIHHSPGFEDYKPPETTMTEEIIMDLTDVQCIATTEKAILVTKKGYQKWIPLSQMSPNTKTIEEGDFLEDIELTENAKQWIPDKPWDKFEVYKR